MHVSDLSGARPASPRADLLIAELAERQHGVVSRAQLLAVGVTDRMIRRRLERRQLYRLHTRVYSISKRPDEAGFFLAAVLASSGVLSHGSAAALWGLRRR